MSSTVSSNHGEKGSFGAKVFKDLCEAIALARSKRAEYFGRLFRSRKRTDRFELSNKGFMK